MKAVRIEGKGRVALVEMELPEPGPGEVQLNVLCCGICGSDLHRYHGKWEGEGGTGHEFCARVTAVGPQVEGLSAGDRVVGECFAHCGHCEPCELGEYNHCLHLDWNPLRPAGGFAEAAVCRASSLFRVPEELTDEQAAMSEPCAVAFHAVVQAGVRAGESVAIVGGGTIGLLCGALARLRGASHVFMVARYAHQAEKARQLGISEPLLPSNGNPLDVVKERTGGRGVDVAIDAVASGTSLSNALALAASKGRVVEVGGVTRPLLVALGPLVGRELQLRGSNCYALTEGRADFEWVMDMMADGELAPEALVTHRFPLSEAAEAFRTAADKQTGAIKVIINMPAEDH